jgi:hypothetical protein
MTTNTFTTATRSRKIILSGGPRNGEVFADLKQRVINIHSYGFVFRYTDIGQADQGCRVFRFVN